MSMQHLEMRVLLLEAMMLIAAVGVVAVVVARGSSLMGVVHMKDTRDLGRPQSSMLQCSNIYYNKGNYN